MNEVYVWMSGSTPSCFICCIKSAASQTSPLRAHLHGKSTDQIKQENVVPILEFQGIKVLLI